MKALQIMAPEKAEWIEAEIPTPGPGQVLVRVLAVTTCPQWDLHIYYGRPMFDPNQSVPFPFTLGQPGHEMTGLVEALGAGVDVFRVGQRVSAWRDQGQHRPGCYAQYAIIDAENLLAVPEEMPLMQTAPLELAMCVGASFIPLAKYDVIRGTRFGVSGLGPAGLVAAQMAKAEGASEVIGLDLSPSRREYALSLGMVDQAVDPRDADALPERNAPGALEVAVDCVGYRSSVEYMFAHTRDIVALFGVQREPYTYTQYTLSIFGYPGHSRPAAEYALSKMIAGQLNLKALVTHEMGFQDYARGVEMLKAQQAIKIGFLPWE